MDPCGTQQTNSPPFDHWKLIKKIAPSVLNNSVPTLKTGFCVSYFFYLEKRISWLTVSKAFDKSKNITTMGFLWSKFDVILFTNSMKTNVSSEAILMIRW